ncbi:MAG TPA: FxLYD domain-containing protein [Candidatus Sulfotelmatobacter sp.]|nr:FxLYD domain-containing protein [Candidatus Sulfotelmatobacter sp.]
MRRLAIWIFLLAVACLLAVAKDQPFQVVSWPDPGQPVLRFAFSKFKDVGGGMGKERTYISDVEALNLSDKTISGASFSFYVFDKGKARIGEGYINLTNISAGETVKFQVTIAASGSPTP